MIYQRLGSVFAHTSSNEVAYASQRKTAYGTQCRFVCALCAGFVSSGWHHRLACRMGLSWAVVLRLLSCRHCLAIPAQPWIGPGAHAHRHLRSARVGSGAFSSDLCPLLCVADPHGVRRRSLSVVTDAGLASDSWDNTPGVLVLPLVPDVSGKLVPLTRRTHSGRARANGGLHGSLSLCTASDVCCHRYLYSGDGPLARILVRTCFGTNSCGYAGEASGAGGTHVAGGTARLCSIYGTGEISSHPVCVVARKRPLQDGKNE